MRRLILLVLVSLFYSTFAWAETVLERQELINDQTFTVDSDDTYYYDGDQVIDAEDHSNVTVINNGNIIAHDTPGSPTELESCGRGCDETVDASGSSNFTLTNNGTIWAGHHRVIDLRAATGTITVTNNAGATIASGERDDGNTGVLDLTGAGSSGDTITITNHGTIQNVEKNYAIIDLDSMTSGAIVNFTNTGLIRQGTSSNGKNHAYSGNVDAQNSTDEINFTNSGTIQSAKQVILLNGSTNFTLTNSGTVKQDGYGVDYPEINSFGKFDQSDGDAPTGDGYSTIQVGISGSGATIINSGTISAAGGNNHAITIGDNDAGEAHSNATIENSGTISAGSGDYGRAIIIIPSASGTITSGTTIKVKEEAEFTGGIDLGKTESTIVLDPSITKDITITVYNYDGDLTITNNLTGNDTYSITEEDLDSDGDADDGTLTILGEDLEIAQDNPKYRSENVLTKLRGLFDASNYINWHFPEDKMFKIFHSTQKRDGTYKGEMSGVVGQLSPFILGDIRNNIFLGYTRQDGDFDNGEFLGGDNFALGLKSVYENNGFKASFTPMIGLNDLTVTDFDTDTKTKISTNLLSEFAGFNTKLGKEIKTSEDSSLSLSVQSTLGVQRFPEYLAKFSEGDLSVDEAIEQVLGAGFEVRYVEGLGKGFVIQPYIGANVNNNLNNSIKITADGENKNVSPANEMTTGYYAGVSFTKKTEDINFDLDLMYGNEDGLINQIAAVSLTKSFGASKTKDKSKKSTKDLKTASINIDENLLEFGKLKEINEQIKAQNKKLKAENEKLKSLYAKTIEENKTSKRLIVELLKENEKIKLEKEIFKNKLLENENKELKEEIESAVADKGVNKFLVLLFVTVLILLAYGITSLIISIFQSSFRKSH